MLNNRVEFCCFQLSACEIFFSPPPCSKCLRSFAPQFWVWVRRGLHSQGWGTLSETASGNGVLPPFLTSLWENMVGSLDLQSWSHSFNAQVPLTILETTWKYNYFLPRQVSPAPSPPHHLQTLWITTMWMRSWGGGWGVGRWWSDAPCTDFQPILCWDLHSISHLLWLLVPPNLKLLNGSTRQISLLLLGVPLYRVSIALFPLLTQSAFCLIKICYIYWYLLFYSLCPYDRFVAFLRLLTF